MAARTFFLFIASICLLGIADASALVPVEKFAAEPTMGLPKISPSGRYVAAYVKRPTEDRIVITDLEAPPATAQRAIAVQDNNEVDWVEWANDERLLAGVSRRFNFNVSGAKYEVPFSRIVAFDIDGKNWTVLFEKTRRFGAQVTLSAVVHNLPEDPKTVLIAADDTKTGTSAGTRIKQADLFGTGRLCLYRVDVYTGKADLVVAGSSATYRFLTDLKGVPRVRWDYSGRSDTTKIRARKGETDQWDIVVEYGESEQPDLYILGFTENPNVAIVASRKNSDRYELVEYDLSTRSIGKTLFRHAAVDVGDPLSRTGGPIYDSLASRLVGVSFVEDLVLRHYFDPALERLQAKLEVSFPGASSVNLISRSRDNSRFTFSTSGPTDPGSFYAYSAKGDKATPLGKAYPDIPSRELGEVLIVRYSSRDKVRLTGYLTLPPGKGDRNLPLVVMPHGGPEVRDFVRYDPWAQMLANRGYAVFQPNFRGSGGYGRAFAEVGHGKWGRLMQDDVTDSVKALIADGTADPGRICIVGASYGGYAALAGGALTPDLYRCVVSIAGVSDLPAMLQEEIDRFGSSSWVVAYWKKRLGDPAKDLAQMKAVSPALQAASFKAPVLLIHGTKDNVVPIDQSKRMYSALRAAGKPVKLVEIRDEFHSFLRVESRVQFYKELETFLATHLGN